jgi:pheophorbide a oxygenase
VVFSSEGELTQLGIDQVRARRVRAASRATPDARRDACDLPAAARRRPRPGRHALIASEARVAVAPARVAAAPPPPRRRLGRAAPAPRRAAEGAERPAAASGATAPAESPAAANAAPLSWARAWYPVTALEYLDPARPSTFTVLGTDLALWRDAAGAWRAFRDRCPHRAAPLSEGALHPASRDLVCAYHGFSFAGSGACTAIPQAERGRAHDTATASRRACALR